MKFKAAQKTTFFIAVISVAFSLLVMRLYYLQIIRGEFYLQRSESNFIQERIIKHSRGRILDSDGRSLADNRPAYDVYVTFAMLPDSLKNLRAIARPITMAKKDLLEIDKKLLMTLKDGGESVVFKKDLSRKHCNEIAEVARTTLLQGVNIEGDDSSCTVSIDARVFPSHLQTFNLLATLLDVRGGNLNELWQKAEKKSAGLGRFKPSLLVPDVGFDAYARIENAIALGTLSGITVVPSKRRRYVYGDFATHVIGMVNQVSLADLQKDNSAYRSGDFIGRNGLEATYENVLRGVDGVERVIVDAKGRRFDEAWEESLLGGSRLVEPIAGDSLKLSINSELQRKAQEVFTGLSGSIVVSEVDTGFVLAMASFPGFDPNMLVAADNAKFFRDLLKDQSKPLRNKAVQDHYMPGSIFKPVTAIAGLSRRLITPEFQHHCSGSYQIHRTVWRCFRRDGHGAISLMQALKVSCDSYFYELGHRMGLEALSEVSEKMGLGRKTGIELLGETAGIVPNKEYYRKRFGYVAPGYVVNMSIGQGDLSVSPIQMAMVYGAIANGGTVYKPQLVKEIINEGGEVIKRVTPSATSSVVDVAYNFDEILHGMSFVIESGGTANTLRYKKEHADINKWINDEGIVVMGKTGTAQVVRLAKNIQHIWNVEEIPYEQRDHSWFVALYPASAPKIVVVVMVEHGGFGGAVSAPIAIRMMKRWHELNPVMTAQAKG